MSISGMIRQISVDAMKEKLATNNAIRIYWAIYLKTKQKMYSILGFLL